MSRLVLSTSQLDERATASLRAMRRIPARREDNGQESAVLQAAHLARRHGISYYVYSGNSYGHTVWRVAYKAGDYLNPINNTGGEVIQVTSDLQVRRYRIDRDVRRNTRRHLYSANTIRITAGYGDAWSIGEVKADLRRREAAGDLDPPGAQALAMLREDDERMWAQADTGDRSHRPSRRNSIDPAVLQPWQDGAPWLPPDRVSVDPIYAVWFAPGDKGTPVVEVEQDDFGNWAVSEYLSIEDFWGTDDFDRRTPFRKTTTQVDANDFAHYLWERGHKVPSDPEMQARLAAAVSMAKLFYYGGDTEDVSRLPRR